MQLAKGITQVKKNASNGDLRVAIENAFPIAVAQPEVKAIAKTLKGATEEQTLQNVYNYVLTNIRYKKDGPHQIVQLPSGLLRTRAGDCKSMSLFVAALLANLGITPTFVYTSYKADPTPSHIYVTANGRILDVVIKRYNTEKKPTHKFKKTMEISYLAGIGDCHDCSSPTQIGAINLKRGVKKVATKAKAATGGVKSIALAPGRLLFLTIIKNNLDGAASKLQRGNITQQLSVWKKAGGDATKYQAAVKQGAAKPQKPFGLFGKLRKLFQQKGIGAFEIDDSTKNQIRGISAAGGAALGSVVPAVGTAVGAGGGASLGELVVQILPIIQQIVGLTAPAASTGGGFDNPGSGVVPAEADEELTNTQKAVVGAGLGIAQNILPIALIGGAIWYFSKKKK